MRNTAWLVSVLPAVFVLATSGCDAIFGDGYEVRLQTDELIYPAVLATKIELTVENRSDEVVYYLCSGEVSIERYEDGDFVDSFGFGNCECLCPRPIEAGESQVRDYEISDLMMEWLEDGPNTEETAYRIRLKLYEDEEFELELESENELSDEFKIAVQK